MATAHGKDRLKNPCVASRSCDVPTSRPALERAEGVPWGLIPQLWYDDSKVGLLVFCPPTSKPGTIC